MEINDVFSTFGVKLKSRISRTKVLLIVIGIVSGFIGSIVGYFHYVNDKNMGLESSPLLNISGGLISGLLLTPLFILFLILVFTIFWFPSDVAKMRGHSYTTLIQILNIAGLFLGVPWFIAAAWAIFPSEKSLIDPIVGNVTGLGRRNAGDTIGAAKQGKNRGAEFEKDTDKQIDALIDMRTKGLISDDEFAKKKAEIIKREY